MARRKKGMFSPNPYTEGAVRLSAAQEVEVVREYQRTGDHSLAESLLKSRAKWVQSILSNFSAPGFVDMDAAFSDAMVSIYTSLGNYNDELSSVGTYLWKVVYNSFIESMNQQKIDAEQGESDLALYGEQDISECMQNVREVINHAPPEMMNERARRVSQMMLRGCSIEEIANALPCTKTVAGEVVAALRNYIAWMMVASGMSAEPIITDEELHDLALEHERVHFSCWK